LSADSPDLDPPDHPVEGPATIFVSDPSAEADRLSTALREKDYTVIDVPLSLLVARVAVQTPSVILLDVSAEGALDEVARLRELPGGEAIHILFLGDRESVPAEAAEALAGEGSGFLSRPVDVDVLLRKIGSLIGAQPPASMPPASPSVRPGMLSSDRSSPSSGRSRRTPPPERPPPALADAADALEPSFAPGMSSASKLPLPALSPEIERLLQGAEERAHELGPPSQLPPRSHPRRTRKSTPSCQPRFWPLSTSLSMKMTTICNRMPARVPALPRKARQATRARRTRRKRDRTPTKPLRPFGPPAEWIR